MFSIYYTHTHAHGDLHVDPAAFPRYCEDIDNYFADLGAVSEIDLGTVTSVKCPPREDRWTDLAEILIESNKTLTIKSTQSTVR